MYAKQFLGLVGYYRQLFFGFAKIAGPLTALLKEEVDFRWGENDEQALKPQLLSPLRQLLSSEPLLQYSDSSQPLTVITDASDYGIGAVLSQGEVGWDLSPVYTSRSLLDAEMNYTTMERELLAVILAC